MDTYKSLLVMFDREGFEQDDVHMRQVGDVVLLRLGDKFVTSSASTGGNAAIRVLDVISQHRGLSHESALDAEPVGWKRLWHGETIRITGQKHWDWIRYTSYPDGFGVTYRDISNITGICDRRVRSQIAKWLKLGLIAPMNEIGAYGTLSYRIEDVAARAAAMPGKGNWRKNSPIVVRGLGGEYLGQLYMPGDEWTTL